MKRPRRQRKTPKQRRIANQPDASDLQQAAERARYIGSPEHKDAPSFAGAPRPRVDATICDSAFVGRQSEIEKWLRTAIRSGKVSEFWEKGFPRYVWYQEGDVVYIARHTGSGQYKGWQLSDRAEWPEGLE